MIVKLEVNVKQGHCVFNLDTEKMSRNYDDECYGYWIETDVYGNVHEINIDKDVKGKFLLTGYDYVWFDYGNFEDGRDADCSCQVAFTLVES